MRRLEKSGSAKTRRNNPLDLATRERLRHLSREYDSLSKAFDENTDVFSRSFCYADAMLWVFRTALNDMLNNTVHVLVAKDGTKQVDLATYLRLYEAHLKEQESGSTEKLIEVPGQDQPTIFGGTE